MNIEDLEQGDGIHPPPSEWDFDPVPDDEIIACCLWEYGRESHTIEIATAQSFLNCLESRRSSLIQKLRADLRVEEWQEREEQRLKAWLNEVGRLGDDHYERLWQTDIPLLEIYDVIISCGGPSAAPWLLLPQEFRSNLVRKTGESSTLLPIAESLVGELEEIWKQNSAELLRVRSENRPENDESEDMAKYSPTNKIDLPVEDSSESEAVSVAFTIDFSRFTDREITAAFKAWLKKHRPDRWKQPRRVFPNSPQRGRKLNDYRTALERLGLMRLLNGNYPTELKERFPETWKRMCRDETHFRRDCKLSCEFFHNLFPFLPKDEQPKSAEPIEVWEPRIKAEIANEPGGNKSDTN